MNALRFLPPATRLVVAGWLLITSLPSAAVEKPLETDLLIVGGTESGWAAAIQAARMGVRSITMVHDGAWLGGQYTEQALACVDENKGPGKVGWGVDWHPMKRSFHRTGLFRELMDGIEAWNTSQYGSPMPGLPWHGPSTFRPAEAERVFRQLLQPWIDSGQVQWITNLYPVKAEVSHVGPHPRLEGLWFRPVDDSGPERLVKARLTIDASDWGEAIQVAGAAYECGPDPRSRYGEPSAPENDSDCLPNEMNPITWAMIVEESDHDVPIERPDRFDDRNFPRSTHISRTAFKDLEWDRKAGSGSIPHWPDKGREASRQLTIFSVRRIVEGSQSRDGRTSILLNYMNGQDYPLERLPGPVTRALEATEPGASQKNIVEMTRAQRNIIFADAKRHSLSLLYHLQQFVHDRAPDKANSFRHFRLSPEFGTPDQLPPKPYIRESLRLKAMYMMREQDGRNRDGKTKEAAKERFSGILYPDGLFCWQFHYDFHRTGRTFLKDEGIEGPWIDYEKPGRHTRHVSDRSVFPMRSLIPVQMDGLLGAQKNVGYSSIVSAAIRLHDQCVALGQAAGATAAVALKHGVQPRSMPSNRSLLEEVRHGLCGGSSGQPLQLWPFRDLDPAHPAFVAINRLGALRILPHEARVVDFQPDQAAGSDWIQSLIQQAKQQFPTWNEREVSFKNASRGEVAIQLWGSLSLLNPKPFPAWDDHDADHDGIPNLEDPLPFTPNEPVVWAVAKPGPDQDGIPGKDIQITTATRRFDFGGNAPGWIPVSGAPFQENLGHGWTKAIPDQIRHRGIFPNEPRDSFIFTRTSAQWNCRLPNGHWKLNLCVGDAGHEQAGQRINVEGLDLIKGSNTAAGAFHEISTTVDVQDGQLTLDLGPQEPGNNTCLNWLILTPTNP